MSTGITSDAARICLVSQLEAADSPAIEAGLNELWRMAEAGEIGGTIVRTASMTTIVPIEPGVDADAVVTLLDGLTESHPCRAILLRWDEQVDEPRARLASHCPRTAEGEPRRYWEEIQLVSPARSLHQAMSTVATLVLPGLPIRAWWPGEPRFDGDLYNHLVEISDRIIVDSSQFTHLLSALPALAEAVEVAHQSIAYADLSWTRLTPWRLLVAEFFDDPNDQALLDSIERVTVEYRARSGTTGDPGEAAQALLLVGWLASRLGWEPRGVTTVGPGAWRFQVIDGVRPVAVDVVRRSRDASPDGPWAMASIDDPPGLWSVTIDAAENGHAARYHVERRGNGDEALTVKQIESGRLEGQASLPPQTLADLLRDELGGFATDRVFQESLALANRLFAAPAPAPVQPEP